MGQQYLDEEVSIKLINVKNRTLKVEICNTWRVLDSQSINLLPQAADQTSFECAGNIKFVKYPVHEGVALLFSAVWEFEIQTDEKIITKRKRVAQFTFLPKFSFAKHQAKVLSDECVD